MDPTVKSSGRSRSEEEDWNRIAASRQFQHLLAVKKAFIIPVFLFFLAYYLLLPVLVGCAPDFMSTRVLGKVTLAYVFALSQFGVGGTIACLYLKASTKFDALVSELLKHRDDPPGVT